MKNRIVICSSPNLKSIPLYFYLLANQFCSEGNEVTLVIDQGGMMDFENFPPNPLLTIKKWPNERPTKFIDFLFFLKLCRSFKPDLVISQFSSNTVSLMVSLFLPKSKFLVYWHTMQDQLIADLKISRIKFLFLNFRKKILFKFSSFDFLTNSSDLKNEIQNFFKKEANKIYVLHYLMPDPLLKRKYKDFNDRDYCISFVSRLEQSKGHANFLRAFSKVHLKFPGLKLKIAGSGNELNFLRNLVFELGIEDRVEFLGECSYEKVLSIMEDSLIHVSNSIQEAFGMVNVEAISLGTPIMANKVGGIKEILFQGQNGEFFNSEDILQFENYLQTILNQENWKTYSKNARDIFEQNFAASNKNLSAHVNFLLAKIQ
ncbi:glycosyltransferase family 1 protein [Algoriphagus kandeliae]|uniref:Glycosyltransferase family 1 protein n=1 Tax=Algoriphagus kandeliae TaxID=2562278 RepID=A0A4Y9QXM5_9BACT|nr:glycosyltransferase [Algoriphagus kandeliae]TFV97214.1 glycosyltransferase family 1 protein [Algoriphagus kandeliae]